MSSAIFAFSATRDFELNLLGKTQLMTIAPCSHRFVSALAVVFYRNSNETHHHAINVIPDFIGNETETRQHVLLVCFVQNFAGLLVVQVRANSVICFHVFFVRVILVVLASGIVRLIFHFYCIESSYLLGGDVIAQRSFDIISQCVFLISTETVALQEPCPGTNEEEAFPVAEDDNVRFVTFFIY